MGQGPLESLLLSVTQGKMVEVPGDLTPLVRETAGDWEAGNRLLVPSLCSDCSVFI